MTTSKAKAKTAGTPQAQPKPEAQSNGKGAAIKIDQEFKKLIIPLSKEEQDQLEQNIRAGGCRDPLVVWKGQDILLDGHHRLEICKKHNLSYEVVYVELPDRDAARNWIRDNQLGRRNLPPEAVSYLRGQHYNATKKPHGGDRKTREASGNGSHKKTEQIFGERYKVDPKTIRNDADFAETLDKIAKNGGAEGAELKTSVLRRDVKVSRGQLRQLADLDKDKLKKAVQKVMEGEHKKTSTTNKHPKKKQAPQTINVPREPQAMVKVLLEALGEDVLKRVCKAIEKILGKQVERVLAKEKPKQGELQPDQEDEEGSDKAD
jgi:hypothetical protein